MNTYTKMTLSSFLERLKEGKYAGTAGARRAVGKSELTDDEKKKANKAIDKHFSDPEEVTTTPAAPQKMVKVERKKAAASEEDDGLRDTHRTVQVTKDALEGLARAKAADAGVNLSDAAQTGVNILGKALQKIQRALGGGPKAHLNGTGRPRPESDATETSSAEAQD